MKKGEINVDRYTNYFKEITDQKRELGIYTEQLPFFFEIRPWGWFGVIDNDKNKKLKIIHIKPNQRLSEQYHKLREEYWLIINGTGIVEIGKDKYPETAMDKYYVKPGDKLHIPCYHLHRATADRSGLEKIEIAFPFGPNGKVHEKDIIRTKDDWGRE